MQIRIKKWGAGSRPKGQKAGWVLGKGVVSPSPPAKGSGSAVSSSAGLTANVFYKCIYSPENASTNANRKNISAQYIQAFTLNCQKLSLFLDQVISKYETKSSCQCQLCLKEVVAAFLIYVGSHWVHAIYVLCIRCMYLRKSFVPSELFLSTELSSS